METTYKIVRFFRDPMDGVREVQETGLTLEEAQAWCQDPASHGEGLVRRLLRGGGGLMAEFTDLHGRRIREGATGKLSGGYADSAVPTYMLHEAVTVVGFGRSRVIVRLDSKDYTDREPLRVLPRTLVLDPPKVPSKPLRNDEPMAERRR